MPARILYLHGLRGGSTSVRQRLLFAAFGEENVRAPDLRTRMTLALYTTAFVLLVGGLIASSVCAFLYWTILGAICLSILLCLFGCLTYILTGRGVTYFMVQSAVAIAEREFKDFRPNVIVAIVISSSQFRILGIVGIIGQWSIPFHSVASSFGAVVALAMDVPKVSLVLLAPAQDAYCRYMRIKELTFLIDYPYVIIIHGGADDLINLDDSIRLVETSGYGNCKLEVIDDDHTFSTLAEGDFKEFVDEAFARGRDTVAKMRAEDMEKPLKKRGPGSYIPTIDPSLFDISSSSHDSIPMSKQTLERSATSDIEDKFSTKIES